MTEEQQIISAFIEELKNQSRGYIRSLQNGESEEMDAELEDALKKNEVIIKALQSSAPLQDKFEFTKKHKEFWTDFLSRTNQFPYPLATALTWIQENVINKISAALLKEQDKIKQAIEWCDAKIKYSSQHISERYYQEMKQFLLSLQSAAPLQEQEEYELVSIGEETVKLVIPPHPDQSSAPMQEQDKQLHEKLQEFISANAVQYNEIQDLKKDYALYKRLAELTMKENDQRIAELEIQLAQAEEHICNLERNLS